MRIGDLLILLLLAALWGASFLFMRIAAPEFGPLPLVAFRMGLAGLALSFVFFQKEARESAKQHWWELLVSGVVGSSLAFILLSYATLTLSAGFTSLMNSSVPIFSAIIAAVWLKERLRLSQFIGLGFGVIGVGILVWGKLDFTSDGQGWPIAACIVACGCYGFGASWMKSKLSKVRPFGGEPFGSGAGADSLCAYAAARDFAIAAELGKCRRARAAVHCARLRLFLQTHPALKRHGSDLGHLPDPLLRDLLGLAFSR
ncbi:DMT family transporter [Akkermansiaceae bacterium]|nr:DMT family transporter [Akkermansiaceae bacterium]